ncbi:MAG: site-specific integrase, partial [Thermoleophilaceae bacterium]
LVWGDLDLKAGVVRLRFQLAEDEDGRLVRGELKTKNAVRNTRIDPGLAARLTQHRLAAFHSDDGDYVFAREDGSPWSLRVFANGFSRAARGAGLRDDPERPNATPHSLRHTYASRLIAGGNDVVRVSKALGHANANITLTIYAHEFDQRNDDGSYVDAIAV